MASSRLSSNVRQYLRKLLGPRESDSLSDVALLERYVEHQDETAFAAIVHRLQPELNALRGEDPGDGPTYFEALTAAAFLYFQ